jgi:glycosyltransferase involved in cell wall biosynthesis
MRIVYLNPSGQSGGAESLLLDALAGLRQAEPEWGLHLIVGESGPLVEKASALGIEVSVIPFPGTIARLGDAGAGGPAGRQLGKLRIAVRVAAAVPSALAYCRKLRRAIQKIQPDLIHSNGFKMHILGLWSRPWNIPIIWHLHDYVSKRPFMRRVMRLHASHCAHAIANSKSVGADMKALCPGLPVSTVLNAIDVASFSPTGPRLDLDALAGLPPAPAGTVKVGLLATMARWKGHAVFLEAIAKLSTPVPVRAYIIGGPVYQTEGSQWSEQELRNLAASLGVAPRIGFTGFVHQPASALRALDIAVHASTDPEPFGLVIVEAMACGRAVIVSAAGGAMEIVREGLDGLAHRPGDAGGLARCIDRLADDPELRDRLGREARSAAVRSFNRTRLAGDLLAIYRDASEKFDGYSLSTIPRKLFL